MELQEYDQEVLGGVMGPPHLILKRSEIWKDLRPEIDLGRRVVRDDLRWPWLWMQVSEPTHLQLRLLVGCGLGREAEATDSKMSCAGGAPGCTWSLQRL